MTNEQIIADIAATIYGEDAVMEMIENGDDIPLHTIKGWDEVGKRKGVKYKVRKGEHGIETRLWKKKKNKGTKNEEVNENSNNDNEELTTNRDFYLCKSFLFRQDQVELVKEK